MTWFNKWFNVTVGLSLAAVMLLPLTLNPQANALESTEFLEHSAPASVITYEPSERYEDSANYTLKANGVSVPVIKGFSDYDYAHFSMSDGPVTYELTILNTDKVHEYSISPKNSGYKQTK